MKHLVLLSGGVDSLVSLLVAKALGGEVHVLHVRQLVTGRSAREKQAVDRIIEKLPVTSFKEASFTFTGYRDQLVLAAFAGAYAQELEATDVWFSDCNVKLRDKVCDLDDRTLRILHDAQDPDLPQVQLRLHSETREGLTKQQARNIVGEDLWALTWGCRLRGDRACWTCHTCKERGCTRASESSGVNYDLLNDYMERSTNARPDRI